MYLALTSYLKVLALIAAAVALYSFGYSNAKTKITLEYQQELNAALAKSISQQNAYNAKINELEKNHLSTIESLKDEHAKDIANMRKSFKPSGVRKCSQDDRQPSANSSSSLICYTESELYERIEKSLVIGRQCDELALKYNALLKVIETYNDAKK